MKKIGTLGPDYKDAEDKIRRLAREGRVGFANRMLVRRFAPEMRAMLSAMGYDKALVTDESVFSDFPDLAVKRLRKAGWVFRDDELMVDVAKRKRLNASN